VSVDACLTNPTTLKPTMLKPTTLKPTTLKPTTLKPTTLMPLEAIQCTFRNGTSGTKCDGLSACDNGANITKIGCGSCIGTKSCSNMVSSVGEESCIGDRSCYWGKSIEHIMFS
jgi:hypothetical protein